MPLFLIPVGFVLLIGVFLVRTRFNKPSDVVGSYLDDFETPYRQNKMIRDEDSQRDMSGINPDWRI